MTTATKAPAAPVKRVTLAELGDDLAVVNAWMEEHDEEMRANEGVVPDALAALLEKVEGDLAKKVERIGLFIRAILAKVQSAAAEKAALAAEVAFYAAREKRFNAQADSLKKYTLHCLIRMGRKKIEGDTLDVRAQLNSAPSVVIPPLSEADLMALHAAGNPFVTSVTTVVYSLAEDGIKSAYAAALAAVGPRPEIDSSDYLERFAAWDEAVHAHMYKNGVPIGVRFTRGMHVRFS